MRILFTNVALGVLLTLLGCNQGTSGGPGATSPPSTKPITGQTEDTFSLIIPSAQLNQGAAKIVSIGINRGKNFREDVSLKFDGLPTGLTLDPAALLIKHGDKEAQGTLKAAADAALGDFTVKVIGHPTKGADAINEMKISIAKQDAANVATDAAAAAKAKWDEYTLAMQKQWDQFNAKYEALKDSAATATGQAKIDLDRKVAETKIKLDAAGAKLEELKSAGADRWDKVKEGVSSAFEDLKKIFE